MVPSPGERPRTPRLPAPTLDDSQLLASLRAGEPDAATAAHDRLRPVVERTIRKLLGPGDRDHEDLAQHAMIEVVYTVDKFRGDCPLDAWASTVAAHVVYNHIRKVSAERRIFENLRADDDDGMPSAQSLSRDMSARSVLRRVIVHLDGIEPAKAWAYVLHDVCGFDLGEVAEITESTVAAAQSRLVRGRRELHERMGSDPELAPMLASEPRDREGVT